MPPRCLVTPLLLSWLTACAPRTPPPPTRPAVPTPTSAPTPSAGPTPAAPADPAALLEKAEAALRARDLIACLQRLDELLQVDPDNRRGLGLVAVVAQELGGQVEGPQNQPLFLRSAWALRRLRERSVELTTEERTLAPQVLYNEACALALGGETRRALDALQQAVDAGFSRLDHFDLDVDLDSLRRLPEFQLTRRTAERRAIDGLKARSRPYPLEITLPDLQDRPVALATLRGKVTLVVFWGTWSLPARKQMVDLADLAKRHGPRGLKVVGLACEAGPPETSREAVETFLERNAISFPCLLAEKTTRDQVAGFQGYPTTLLLDHEGKVRLNFAGFQPRLTLETAVDLLLSEGGPAAAAKKPAQSPAPSGK